jgi:hypothetical protein
MATGYFAGLLAFVYRETADARRVTARRLFPFVQPQWLLVLPDAQARFERRFKLGHVASMLTLAVGMRFVRDDASFGNMLAVALAIGVVAFPVAQWWATTGLPAYEGTEDTLVPVRRFELHERQARAMGTRTLTTFVVLSVLLTIPQLVVAVADGFWWAWLGVAMFASTGVFFARMLVRLRAEEQSARAT